MKTLRPCAPRALAFFAALAFLASPSLAADYHVDAVHGSDANGGTSSLDAWRTLTHALATVPNPAPDTTHTIHVAPGVHDALLGEVFPLAMRPDLRVVGAGPESSVIDGGGAAVTLVAFDASCSGGACAHFDLDALLAGFTLRDAATGVGVGSDFYAVAGTLEDLVITGISGSGVVTGGGAMGGAAPVELVLRRVRVEAPGAHGLSMFHGGEGGGSEALLEDCVIADAGSDGVRLQNFGDTSSLSLQLVRSRVDLSGGHAVRVEYSNWSSINTSLEDSALLRSGGDGVWIDPDSGIGGFGNVCLERSTVAANAGAGLRLVHGGGAGDNCTRIINSIVAGNGDDLVEGAPASVVEIAWSCIEDGDYAGVNGTFAADPLFIDPVNGDFRLRYGSPCVDAGDPLVTSGVDLDGTPRPLDGDLDTVLRVDVGALELAPLAGGGEVPLGGTLALELFGPTGGTARLLAVRGTPLVSPDVTPFGLSYLDRTTLYRVTALPTAPGGMSFTRTLPNDPALAGQTFALQALVSTGGVPSQALSNVITVLVTP